MGKNSVGICLEIPSLEGRRKCLEIALQKKQTEQRTKEKELAKLREEISRIRRLLEEISQENGPESPQEKIIVVSPR